MKRAGVFASCGVQLKRSGFVLRHLIEQGHTQGLLLADNTSLSLSLSLSLLFSPFSPCPCLSISHSVSQPQSNSKGFISINRNGSLLTKHIQYTINNTLLLKSNNKNNIFKS